VPIVLDYGAATMTAKLKFSIVGQESESIMDMNQPDHLEPLMEPLEAL
jgi:hypothetical protein